MFKITIMSLDYKERFYKDLSDIHSRIKRKLNSYLRSTILQEYYTKKFNSIVYARLLDTFFRTLTKETIRNYNLPYVKISSKKEQFKNVQNDIKKATLFYPNFQIDKEYFNRFKSKFETYFPQYILILKDFEKIINIKELNRYIKVKNKELKETGRVRHNHNLVIYTRFVERYISKNDKLPTDEQLILSISEFFKKARKSNKTLQKIQPYFDMIQRLELTVNNNFQNKEMSKWKEPLTFFHNLIHIYSLIGMSINSRISGKNFIQIQDKNKIKALMAIHTRCLQICYEIEELIKLGFIDAANSRWRSLYELTVISLFLSKQNDTISDRYINHGFMKSYKEIQLYKKNYRKLKLPPLGRKVYSSAKKKYDDLINKYGNDYKYSNGFEWIPSSILKNKNFSGLEEYEKLTINRGFYSLSSNSIHGGFRGMHSLELIRNIKKGKIIIGSTDFGLGGIIENTLDCIRLLIFSLKNIISQDFENRFYYIGMSLYNDKILEYIVKNREKVKKKVQKAMTKFSP